MTRYSAFVLIMGTLAFYHHNGLLAGILFAGAWLTVDWWCSQIVTRRRTRRRSIEVPR